MKYYRRFIRIGGDLISSPRFTKKKDAEAWYHTQRRNKQFLRDGITLPQNNDGPLVIEYCRMWIKRRMETHPRATWSADEQRLRDYVLPLLSELPLASITGSRIRNFLSEISKEGFLKPKFKISSSTRDRVKALLSAIFTAALNEDPPLVAFNPVRGLKISEKRTGKKWPDVLGDAQECLKFLKCARETSDLHFIVCATLLMGGLRKQELIALRWSNIDFKGHQLVIAEKLEQASMKIFAGTKRGADVSRRVSVSKHLVAILRWHRIKTKPKSDQDFVFQKNGKWIGPRKIWQIVSDVRKRAKVTKISPHGLRHTFGREFALNTGNIKALQAILGHASSSTTDIYSDLAGNRLKPFSEAVSYKIKNENRVKRSDG